MTAVGVNDARIDVGRSTGLEGHYAGIVTRFVAFVVDVLTISVLFSLGGQVVEYVLTVLLRDPVRLSEAPVVSKVALVVWVFFYFAYPLAASGRTFGMAAFGVRAVRADGGDLGGWHAVLRVPRVAAELPAPRVRLPADRAPPGPTRSPRPHRRQCCRLLLGCAGGAAAVPGQTLTTYHAGSVVASLTGWPCRGRPARRETVPARRSRGPIPAG